MPKALSERVADLATAALKSEGAQFAVHDLVARMLARLPEADVRNMVDDLIEHADELDGHLGADRLVGYKDEMRSISEEIEHARLLPKGVFARLLRS
jgi:hypothetical protein